MSIFEQNSHRHDYNTCQKSNFQPKFCTTNIFIQRVNNMRI